MRFRISYQAAILIALIFSGSVSAATYTKTITMPPSATVMGTGTPNMAANILEVGMQGVEFIPSAASESRAVAAVTKGLSIPTSGIVSALKTGLRANAGSLALGAVVSGLVAGVDWVMTDGVLMKRANPNPTTGLPAPLPGDYSWRNPWEEGPFSSAAEACEVGSSRLGSHLTSVLVSETERSAQCLREDGVTFTAGRSGTGCTSPRVYDGVLKGCALPAGSPTPTALSDSDYDVLDGFVKGKDGVWQRGLADEVCKSSGNYDACIQNMGAVPYLSGPSTVSSPDVTTQTQTQNSDGTSTEVSTKTRTDYNLGYPSSSPGSITIDPKTTTQTTTTTKDANGTIISTGTTTDTTTTTQPGSGTQLADGTFTDTPFPDVGPFYKQQFPGGFKDVWEKNKASFDSSPFVSFLKSFVPSFSGSCPSWSMSFDIMPHANFGSREFGSLCYIFDVIKVIMLVTAMFTCRAIIFGG